MRLKTLLLGSATALAVAGGAQAADLSIAEPVDYVRVCDAFGVGYWYIPGTDTCIKIWGFVRFDVSVYSEDSAYGDHIYDETYPVAAGGNPYWYFANSSQASNHYDFATGVYFEVTVKSMTDWGPLEAVMAAYNWGFDNAHIKLGPLKVGYFTTTFAFDFPYVINGDTTWYQAQHKTNIVQLAWAVNGVGLSIAAEEPNYNSIYPYYDPSFPYYSAFPDVVAALTFSNAAFDAKVSAVYSDLWSNLLGTSAWAAAAGVVVKLDSIAPGDKLLLKAAYGNALSYVLGDTWFGYYSNIGTYAWSALASFKHYFSPNLYASATVNYGQTAFLNFTARSWQAEFDLSYQVAPSLWITPTVRYISLNPTGGFPSDSDLLFLLRAEKSLF